MKRGRAELALAGVTIIWGTTFVVVKNALDDISTFLFLALRFSLAALMLGAIYRKRLRLRVTPGRGSATGPGLLAGLLLFAAYVCQTAGLKLTTPSKSAFLTGLSIPMVPLWNSLVYRSRPRLAEVAGILIASLGMALMALPPSSDPWFESLVKGFDMSRGDVLSFLCAVLFAIHIVVIGHYSAMVGFQALAVIQVAVAGILGASLFWLIEPVRFHLSAGVVGALLVTGLLATGLAFTTQAWAQQYTSATRAAVIFALEPVIAWLTSYWLTGENLANRGKVGAGLILAGILAVELKRTKFEEHQLKRAASCDI
jgi:drug/metabolite transporter (DMT)-like permease